MILSIFRNRLSIVCQINLSQQCEKFVCSLHWRFSFFVVEIHFVFLISFWQFWSAAIFAEIENCLLPRNGNCRFIRMRHSFWLLLSISFWASHIWPINDSSFNYGMVETYTSSNQQHQQCSSFNAIQLILLSFDNVQRSVLTIRMNEPMSIL